MEIWDLYTENREKTGQTMIRGEKQPKGKYRIVVHICVFNSRGEMLIQKRQPFKKGWSGLWDVSVGGSAVSGETSREAAVRELAEELGLRLAPEAFRLALTTYFEGGFDDIYVVGEDADVSSFCLQYEEVERVRWAEIGEIYHMIDEGSFIPYHKDLIGLLFFLQNHDSTHTREDDTTPRRIENGEL